MADKEIIIDGAIYNGCNGCSLYDGNVCTGAKTYEDNAKRDRHICDEHLASQFWVVYKQLARKEQECNKLYIQLKADEEYHKEEENTLRKIIKNKEERNIELYKENNKLKQTFNMIKEIMKEHCRKCKKHKSYYFKLCCTCKYTDILQKISEVENE